MSGTNEGFEQQVRERAFALWQQAGSPEGRAEEFWHQARNELEGHSGPAHGSKDSVLQNKEKFGQPGTTGQADRKAEDELKHMGSGGTAKGR